MMRSRARGLDARGLELDFDDRARSRSAHEALEDAREVVGEALDFVCVVDAIDCDGEIDRRCDFADAIACAREVFSSHGQARIR